MAATLIPPPHPAVTWLRTPHAVRERCAQILAAARRGETPHFAVVDDRLEPTAAYVVATIRANYPGLDIPYHARWRHFATGGVDRWTPLAQTVDDRDERARMAIELVIVSVLLDAGAGAAWRYREADSGLEIGRSEGLAVASFHAYRDGAFAEDGGRYVDAAGLRCLGSTGLAEHFQVTAANPLVGIDGRVELLEGLATVLEAQPGVFGPKARLGRCYDLLRDKAVGGELPLATVLTVLLETFAGVWPPRLTLAGHSLGDVWHHPAAVADDITHGLVPFHKLSQWLAYSLVEPLEEAGIRVVEPDALTGLPEYRNGGLLLDSGLLMPRDPALYQQQHPSSGEVVVEWRALTVALLDELATPIRQQLGLSAEAMPLARVLEGGTWSAGRRIAQERRADGGPPLDLVSDGTVF